MEGESQYEGEPREPAPEPREEPTIRTMKSDVQELLKTTKPSLVELIEKEAKRQQTEGPPAGMGASAPRGKKIILLIGSVIVLALLAGAGVWRATRGPSAPSAPPPEAAAPAPLFGTEFSRTIEGSFQNRAELIRLMQDAIDEPQRPDSFQRILIKITDPKGDRFATMDDFLSLYRIIPPSLFLQGLEPGIMPFSYWGARDTHAFGIAARTRDPNRTLAALLNWELTLAKDFEPFLVGAAAPERTQVFEDRAYRNIDWRFLKLSSEQDIGIGYAVFPARGILIIAASRASMEAVIDRLFSGR